MTKFTHIVAVLAASLALGAQAQNSTSGQNGNSSSDQNSTGSSLGSQSSQNQNSSSGISSSERSEQHRYSATGRAGQPEARASQIIGSDLKGSEGSPVGKIQDVLFNPNSGRVDFAIISLSASGNQDASSSASSTATPPSSSSNSSGEKLVAVPWTLLRPSGAAGYSSSSGSSTSAQLAFTFTGDKSKLEAAPSFSQSNWPDVSQQSWRQSIYTHFGMSSGSATGAASSPGTTGFGSGRSSTDSSATTSPNSSSSSSSRDNGSSPSSKPQK